MAGRWKISLLEKQILIVSVAVALLSLAPAHGFGQETRTPAGRRRCPTCAPEPAATPGRQAGAPSRRAVGTHTPSTSAEITLGAMRYSGIVDAECAREERAPVGGPKAYFRIMYPWFGRQVGADEEKWRFDLEIVRGPTAGVYQNFVFSFHDGSRSGTIQVLPGATRYGSGTVRVTTQGDGARFEVQGQSDKGESIHAVLVCPAFEASEAGGG